MEVPCAQVRGSKDGSCQEVPGVQSGWAKGFGVGILYVGCSESDASYFIMVILKVFSNLVNSMILTQHHMLWFMKASLHLVSITCKTHPSSISEGCTSDFLASKYIQDYFHPYIASFTEPSSCGNRKQPQYGLVWHSCIAKLTVGLWNRLADGQQSGLVWRIVWMMKQRDRALVLGTWMYSDGVAWLLPAVLLKQHFLIILEQTAVQASLAWLCVK